MGVLESIAAISAAITAIIGLVYFAIDKVKKSQLEEYAKRETELELEISRAKDDAERKRLSEELNRLRNR